MADINTEDGSSAATPMTDTQLDQIGGGAVDRNRRWQISCFECGWESSWGTEALANSQWTDHAAATGHTGKHSAWMVDSTV